MTKYKKQARPSCQLLSPPPPSLFPCISSLPSHPPAANRCVNFVVGRIYERISERGRIRGRARQPCRRRRQRGAPRVHLDGGGGHTHARLKISGSPARAARSRVDLDPTDSGKRGRKMDLLRYRKIIIYALTFLAYAWSGYGAGLLTNLRDAVLAAETVFQDLFSNAITVAKKIKDIHEVFDAAVEEHCVFQCPDGAYFPASDAISSVKRYQVISRRERRYWSISPIDSRGSPLILIALSASLSSPSSPFSPSSVAFRFAGWFWLNSN